MQQNAEAPKTVEQILVEAIGRTRLIVADYNGKTMRLAPHQLFSRRGDFFVSAFNADKSIRSDEEPRLGHFKVAGLSNVALTDTDFAPLKSYDNSLPHAHDEQIFAVAVP